MYLHLRSWRAYRNFNIAQIEKARNATLAPFIPSERHGRVSTTTSASFDSAMWTDYVNDLIHSSGVVF